MTASYALDNIDALQARELDAPRGWEITFRSTNPGMCHQLYVNGHLADSTETPDRRRFHLPSDGAPRELAIIAVDPSMRDADLHDALPANVRRPTWEFRTNVIRSTDHRPGDVVSLHTDHASGEMDPAAAVAQEVWPAWAARWAFGEDAFGLGGFGYDGHAAPGLGVGGFGAGLFGFGAELIPLHAPLSEEGEHALVLRTTSADGRAVDAPALNFVATPPPAPPLSLTAAAYDPNTNTLTLQIEEDES